MANKIYPTTEDAYNALTTFEKTGEHLDCSKLHPLVQGDDGNSRDMSATLSVLVEVVKDLKRRIEVLELKP